MSGKKDLQRWVSDQLHRVLGYSESSLSQFVVALATSSTSQGDLVRKLGENDVPLTDASRAFAGELYSRIPRSSSSASASSSSSAAKRRRPQTNAELMRESQSYGLLVDDEEEAGGGGGGGAGGKKKKEGKSSKKKKEGKSKKERKEKKKKNIRRRRSASSSSSSDDDGGGGGGGGGAVVVPQRQAKMAEVKKTKAEMAADIAAELEEKYLQEFREMQGTAEEGKAFGKRLIEKDKKGTRKVGAGAEDGDEDGGEGGEGGEGGDDAEEDAAPDVDDLRKESRWQYLNKREEQQLKLLEWQVKDDEMMFGEGTQLSKEERRQMDINKELLRLAQERQKGEDLDEGYRLPDGEVDEEVGGRERERGRIHCL